MQPIHQKLHEYSYSQINDNTDTLIVLYQKTYPIDDFIIICNIEIEQTINNEVMVSTKININGYREQAIAIGMDPNLSQSPLIHADTVFPLDNYVSLCSVTGPGNKSIKNKKGQITDKIVKKFLEIIDRFEHMNDFRKYKTITWPIIKSAIKNGWKMCDCWIGHEEHCTREWPSFEYDFVTFTNDKYVITTDIMNFMRIWIDRREYIDALQNFSRDCLRPESAEPEPEKPLFYVDNLSLNEFQVMIMELLVKYAN